VKCETFKKTVKKKGRGKEEKKEKGKGLEGK
jgi:hypothetical protein